MGNKKIEASYYTLSKGWKTDLIVNVPIEDKKYERIQWPDETVINYFIGRFENEAEKSERALKLLFANKPSGYSDDDYMYIKVSMLNDIYSTHLSNFEKDGMVSILSKYNESILSNTYSKCLVQNICSDCKKQIKKEPYSFVTKYCSHQREDLYPIFDRYVVTMLRWYRDMRIAADYNDFDFDELALKSSAGNYNQFRDAIKSFKDLFDDKYTFKQIDMFLWSAGKNYFPIYVPEDCIPGKKAKY